MTSLKLEKLVDIGQLKKEPGDQTEFDGLVHSGRIRLDDACRETLSIESRFDLVYNAAHAFSLAALRWNGYRSDNRYIVFQCLPHTLGVGPEVWRILAHCHGLRNRGEYEGLLDITEQLIRDLILATVIIRDSVDKLGLIS
ncbi:MAG: hypothetical protein GXP52_03230 [Deltaproteobacteria bacterium]|nr:hypothetical protein [Deltaproteobacteria bacterium]